MSMGEGGFPGVLHWLLAFKSTTVKDAHSET